MAESYLQKRARLKREKAAREAKQKQANIAEGQRIANERKRKAAEKDELAKARKRKQQRDRNQGR